ncbi:MAG TPA: GyrI-like domain-containing protein [Ktedonobacterales bacterium]|jgi:hypothetical protein
MSQDAVSNATSKLDLKKQLRHLYAPSAKEANMVTAPAMSFLMIDGAGDPNTSPDYQQALETLYGVAYPLKFLLKREQSLDYVVMPLEGLWWTPDMADFTAANKAAWLWTMMIMQPDEVTPELFARAVAQARRKNDTPALGKLRLEQFDEGLAAQIMYLGPYAAEGPTITRLHQFIQDHGYTFDGLRQKHHEIYLSDPRRTAPEKLKTIIRQPVRQR